MSDIRIKYGYLSHPKIVKLKRRLGPEGIFSHLELLMFTGENRPKGMLSNMNYEDIEIAAKWDGEKNEFVNNLIELKLLYKTENDDLAVHDWKDHNSYRYYGPERSLKASNAAKAKHAKTKIEQCSNSKLALLPAENNSAPSPSPSPSPSPNPKIKDMSPKFEYFVDLFYKNCPKLGKLKVITGSRKITIKARLKEHPEYHFWEEYFAIVGKSSFLNGVNNRKWKADFDWILKPKNFIKIIEGGYDNPKNSKGHSAGKDYGRTGKIEIS